MKKLVIFDLDGTLFNTTLAMAACGNYALSKLGLPLLTPRDYAEISGVRVEEFTRGALKKAGENVPFRTNLFWKYYLEQNEATGEGANVPYDGIVALLSDLKAKGVLLAVLSNKDDASCTPIVEGEFGKGLFDVIRGQRADTPPKPDPTGVKNLLVQFGVKETECLYVGDTEVDMETAKRAGVPAVAVLWGYRDRAALEAFAPEYVVSHPSQILSLL